MAEKYSTEWWRWRINRKLADFIDRPDDTREAALLEMLRDYRAHRQMQCYGAHADEHEYAMDWR